MSAYRCATCNIEYRTCRALTMHLRTQQDNGETHAACNDSGHHSTSSVTNMNSAKNTRSSVLLDSPFEMSDQPLSAGGASLSGSYTNNNAVGHAHSPDPFEVGDSNMLSDSFESPGGELSLTVSHQLPDASLCNKLLSHVQSGHGSIPLSTVHTSEFKLLNICKPYSLKLYDEIIQWVQESYLAGVDFLSKLRTRQAVLKHIEIRFNLQGSHPQTKTVFLPGCAQHVQLMIHDFKDQLYSLLSDPTVMCDENLLFHNNNPFHPPLDTRQRNGQYVYQDVNDGSVYYDAYQAHCTAEGRDVLVQSLLSQTSHIWMWPTPDYAWSPLL